MLITITLQFFNFSFDSESGLKLHAYRMTSEI